MAEHEPSIGELGDGYTRGSVNDWSKLTIRDGVIHYRIYQQDGSMQPMTAPDTLHNRQIVSWIQIHDRS
jgi:hypothetical protein